MNENEYDEIVDVHLSEIEMEIGELLPSCKNCNRWLQYKDKKGICNSNAFEKDSYTTILTKYNFFCGDFKPRKKIK